MHTAHACKHTCTHTYLQKLYITLTDIVFKVQGLGFLSDNVFLSQGILEIRVLKIPGPLLATPRGIAEPLLNHQIVGSAGYMQQLPK